MKKQTHRPPKLTPIRMPLKIKDERLSEDKRYLAKIDGRWHTGSFTLCWFGWRFHYGWTSLQISSTCDDKMDERWQKLYEIS